MADQEEIYEIIADHILNESEDGHLDFKLKWHSDFPPLLKDITAMANSSDDKNSYIVFGVSDDFNIVGLTAEDQRYKKADIAAVIRDTHFAGNGVPEIDLHSVYIGGKQLDVLEIKKSNSVPYYITTPKKPISPFIPWHFAGNWGFYLSSVESLEQPIPMKGMLGFWEAKISGENS